MGLDSSLIKGVSLSTARDDTFYYCGSNPVIAVGIRVGSFAAYDKYDFFFLMWGLAWEVQKVWHLRMAHGW